MGAQALTNTPAPGTLGALGCDLQPGRPAVDAEGLVGMLRLAPCRSAAVSGLGGTRTAMFRKMRDVLCVWS